MTKEEYDKTVKRLMRLKKRELIDELLSYKLSYEDNTSMAFDCKANHTSDMNVLCSALKGYYDMLAEPFVSFGDMEYYSRNVVNIYQAAFREWRFLRRQLEKLSDKETVEDRREKIRRLNVE